MDNFNFDYKLKTGLPSQDFDLVPWDADVLKALYSTAVVHMATKSLADYYGGIFDAASDRLRTVEPAATREEYVAAAVGMMEDEYAALRDPARLADVSADGVNKDIQHRLNEATARFSFLGTVLPEEMGTEHYSYCRLQGGAVGALGDGTVFTRRTSALATVICPVREVSFDGEKLVAPPETATGAATPAVPRAENFIVPLGDYNHTPNINILAALNGICDLLSFVPMVGPVFGVIGTSLGLVSAISGGEPDFNTALSTMTDALILELGKVEVRDAMGNIKTWDNRLRELRGGLEEFGNSAPPEHVLKEYREEVKGQLINVHGTMANSIGQLQELWTKTGWEQMDLLEDVLKALALGLGYKLMAHNDQVLVSAQLAQLARVAYQTAVADRDEVKAEDAKERFQKYTADVTNAYGQYRTAIHGVDVTPKWVKDRIGDWKWQRGYPDLHFSHYPCSNNNSTLNKYPYNVATFCKIAYAGWTFVVIDNGRNKQELVWCDWASYHEDGASWANGRLRDYQQRINNEVRDNLDPLQVDCDKMVRAFEDLKLGEIEELKDPR